MGELNFCCTLSCLQEGGNKKILLWRQWQWRITHVEVSMTQNILLLIKPSLKFEAKIQKRIKFWNLSLFSFFNVKFLNTKNRNRNHFLPNIVYPISF